MGRTLSARVEALEASNSRIEKLLEQLVSEKPRVSEPTATVKAESEFPGFTAARKAHAGGYCRKHKKGFAFSSGYAFHKTWCTAR